MWPIVCEQLRAFKGKSQINESGVQGICASVHLDLKKESKLVRFSIYFKKKKYLELVKTIINDLIPF